MIYLAIEIIVVLGSIGLAILYAMAATYHHKRADDWHEQVELQTKRADHWYEQYVYIVRTLDAVEQD